MKNRIMKTYTRTEKNGGVKQYQWLESLYVLILGLYPMRHIYIGLDLWDTGYSYANFQYMGMEHMDSMWLFATYLSNAIGHFLMGLPGADSLAGMNFYTGLFVSGLALVGYFFCTKKLQISPLITFVGEFLAISLCWCPTAKLYDYITYVFYTACVMLLYVGLTKEKKRYLFIAGICLGLNVLVRFSNLPEAAMIVAVWAYGVLEALEWRKRRKQVGLAAGLQGTDVEGRSVKSNSGAWGRTVSRTLWCLGGYISALAVMFGYIGIRYGLDEYVAGIRRLFAMTDDATDYKATSMLSGLIISYKRESYWAVRVLFFVLVGIIGFAMVRALCRYCKPLAENEKAKRILNNICYAVCILLGVAALVWLYAYGFCSFAFYSYDSMLRPGVLFLMLTMGIAVIRIFSPNCSKEEKLISGMILLKVLLTSIGSNNGVYPSLNHLFIAAPYTFWQCAKFVGTVKEKEFTIGKKLFITVHPLAAKSVLAAFLAMVLFQSTMFGAAFVFVEGTGVQNATVTIENNEILKGIQMPAERAEWLSSITAYVKEQGLEGREVILYGDIPSLAYYLQMPPAFNSWCDLRSYSTAQMEKEMQEVEAELAQENAVRPVIIVKREAVESLWETKKGTLIADFMEQYDYQKTFENDKFVLWE